MSSPRVLLDKTTKDASRRPEKSQIVMIAAKLIQAGAVQLWLGLVVAVMFGGKMAV